VVAKEAIITVFIYNCAAPNYSHEVKEWLCKNNPERWTEL
jgi:hypothetical protein